MKKSARLVVVVTEEKRKEVEKLAEEKGLSMSSLLNLAIAELVKKNK